MGETREFRERLSNVAPSLWKDLTVKAGEWTAPLLKRLESERKDRYPKTFNDPIWGDIVLFPWETLFLDSPLLQRLRGVRQLGMAHMVYPGAGYDRLEHCRGVVEAAERMIRALERNADFRRRFGRDKDEHIPQISERDRVAIRLAALLHDIGHGAFSHATEMLIQSRLLTDFEKAIEALREKFAGVTQIAAAEVIATLLILSEPLRAVFENPNLGLAESSVVPLRICARILGSRDFLDAGYLSGVVSGPLDADKLDYMARDSHHAGLPIGLDLRRLISKLEVVTITPDSVSNPEMKRRAEESTHKRYHEIGISLSGLGAYEQMIIGRVILYDRLYYHHKVRSAEAMVRRLIQLAEEERGDKFTVRELFCDIPDDTVVSLLGGILSTGPLKGGGPRSLSLATAIQNREVYYRAFAFAPRFIAGLRGLPEQERRDSRALKWTSVLGELSSLEGCDALAEAIYQKATLLQAKIKGLTKTDNLLQSEHIVVDLPVNKTVVRGGDILTRTEEGDVATPNLFFDPERWSQAYEHQKQCGFVFTPREFVRLVGLASRIVFFERYQLVMDKSADRASKTAGDIKLEWFEEAAQHNLCSGDCAAVYRNDIPLLVVISEMDLSDAIPDAIKMDDAGLVTRMYQDLLRTLPLGLTPSLRNTVLLGLRHMLTFIQSLMKNGDFMDLDNLKEKDLQSKLRSHLEAREADVTEGSNLGGGETDLVLSNALVIENKVIRTRTCTPLTDGVKFSWQTRRYSIAISKRIAFEMVAYLPKDEPAIFPMSKSLVVTPIQEGDFVIIRFVAPWGYSKPSAAKPPD